jgi:hypothetical protein
MTKPVLNDILELQNKLIALREAGWRVTDNLHVEPPVARVVLDTHEIGPALQQSLDKSIARGGFRRWTSLRRAALGEVPLASGRSRQTS